MSKNKVTDSVFLALSQVDVNANTKKKNGLTYLSWAFAWAELIKRYPEAEFEIKEWPNEQGVMVPYLFDPLLGYLVEVAVTIEGKTRKLQLPVMDSGNNAQKHERYSYEVAEWGYNTQRQRVKTGTTQKWVEAATMFDINTTIMRCLVKVIGLHGLGLYIYAGEDLPYDASVDEVQSEPNDKVASIEKGKAPTKSEKAPVVISGTVNGKVTIPEPKKAVKTEEVVTISGGGEKAVVFNPKEEAKIVAIEGEIIDTSKEEGPGDIANKIDAESTVVVSGGKGFPKVDNTKKGAIQPSKEFDTAPSVATKADPVVAVQTETLATESPLEEEKRLAEETSKRRLKVKIAFATLDAPKVLKHLIVKKNLKYFDVVKFVEEEPIDLVLEIYNEVKSTCQKAK